MSRKLLALDEAAESLGVSPRTIVRWINKGRLPALLTPGGQYRISEDELDAILVPAAEAPRGALVCPACAERLRAARSAERS